MIALLIIGLGGLAFLAVWLKRRHKRKAEEKQAALSGFPIEREKAGSRASTANLESLFGPAQHMAATRGWEYPDESDGAAAAALAGEKRRSTRASRRHSSRRGKESGAADTIQEMSADRSRSRKRRDQEKERERNKDIERGLRGAKGKDIEKS
jgi:type II secretory pathway pseudopilin PulG